MFVQLLTVSLNGDSTAAVKTKKRPFPSLCRAKTAFRWNFHGGGEKYPQHGAWTMFVYHQELLDTSSSISHFGVVRFWKVEAQVCSVSVVIIFIDLPQKKHRFLSRYVGIDISVHAMGLVLVRRIWQSDQSILNKSFFVLLYV